MFANCSMANVKLPQSIYMLVFIWILISIRAETAPGDQLDRQVNKTILQDAVAKNAVCLDGSPPAYHFDKGFGDGIDNWIVYLEGGGWCHNKFICGMRSRNMAGTGSSRNFWDTMNFTGILSKNPKENPYMYNWNRIYIKYCDGGGFAGAVTRKENSKVIAKFFDKLNLPYWSHNNGTLHFRGAKIFSAVVKELLAQGMKNAENAILAGASAGGLGAILNCDKFHSMLPNSTKVKCLADSGFFMDMPDIDGKPIWKGPYEMPGNIEVFFSGIVSVHKVAKNLPWSCTSRMNASLCLFPQNMVSAIQTPLFILNSAFDSWQVETLLRLNPSPLCAGGVNCPPVQLERMRDLRTKMINEVTKMGTFASNNGWYINSCFGHVQSLSSLWTTPLVNNETIAEAFNDWFFERRVVRNIEELDKPKFCPLDQQEHTHFASTQGLSRSTSEDPFLIKK